MATGIIGVGSMGAMLARGWVRTGALPAPDLWLANRSSEKLARLAAELPGTHAGTPDELAARCRRLFLCTRGPESVQLIARLAPLLTPDHLLVLLHSPLVLAAVESRLPCRVAKLIPSLTHEVQGGVSLFVHGSRITAEDRAALQALMAGMSRPVTVSEEQLRTCADLASCGPALLAYVLAAMAHAARTVRPDLPEGLAEMIVGETVAATVRLLAEGGMSPEQVVGRVAVPGGNTAAALAVLEHAVPAAWEEAFRATLRNEARLRASLGM
jgi:competence protein ComER